MKMHVFRTTALLSVCLQAFQFAICKSEIKSLDVFKSLDRKTLSIVDGMAADLFWKKYDAGKFDARK